MRLSKRDPLHAKHMGVVLKGGGMDMGYELVSRLSRVLRQDWI